MPRHPETVITPNTLLVQARQRLMSPRRPGQHMSRAELADAVNVALDRLYPGRNLTAHYVDHRWVGKLERGEHRWPSQERRAALRHILGATTDAELDLYSPRRTQSYTPVPGASTVSADSNDRLNFALAHPQLIDHATVEYIRAQVGLLDARYDREPSAALLGKAGEHHGMIDFFRSYAKNTMVRRQLSGAFAESALLLGQLLWDASLRRDHTSALSYFRSAVRSAEEFGEPLLAARAQLRSSIIALYGQDDPESGIALAAQAAATSSTASQALSGLALLHVAEGYAMQGDVRACEHALREAEASLWRISVNDRAAFLVSPVDLSRMAGSCYLRVDDIPRAISWLEGALRSAGQTKAAAVTAANLCLAFTKARQVDDAVGSLHQAISIVQATGGGGGLTATFTAGRALTPWHHDSAVQDVHDRLLSLMAK